MSVLPDTFIIAAFQEKLLAWYDATPRPMPWKETNNPYHIWLSEIILQQTRVAQGLPYYLRFVEKYPTINALADAPEEEVFKLWEGLGYYSRARNLHATAKFIAYTLNGNFPDTFAALLSLQGVGHYTAAAIASFAYNLPHAVIDGNVYRVLSRILGSATPIDSAEGKKYFAATAQALLNLSQPARYNQAIMNFGALHCVPQNPHCSSCPFQEICVGFQNNCVGSLPVRQKKIAINTRYFYYYIIQDANNDILIQRRNGNDIWRGLYEFPMEEVTDVSNVENDKKNITLPCLQSIPFRVLRVSKPYRQQLTHQKIIAIFMEIQINTTHTTDSFLVIPQKDLSKYALPRIIDLYIKDDLLTLL
ncbi:MAG: A/G-specific adenine glycosylase [Saprospiraceae bacterium]|nr:A/G-specific adenine glycosylase [Saprospiraceae bacterium]